MDIQEFYNRRIKKNMSWWMLKNSAGQKDAFFTMSVVAFVVVTLVVFLSMIKEVMLGKLDLKLTMPDTSLLTLYVTSTFGVYALRRNASDKLNSQATKTTNQESNQ